MTIPSPLSPEAWMTHLFSAQAACKGQVIRRKLRDVERYAGRAKFEQELRRRGFHAVENAGQIKYFAIRSQSA
ncbi:N-(5'-phosphoribosyl)anthranilate isomerase [Sulfitobacter sp. F26169L]|uniref:N-(5'-phosphoribosyl)anthranilate isomerase n=1 Tax=Sulfitobacter sp. F26169L TaxID=2996015 RepID=UPI002B2140A1|nr:N-(5'-phosphoribosyl)anthranilate isomerase [Sulfitobacter sp. F26169L]